MGWLNIVQKLSNQQPEMLFPQSWGPEWHRGMHQGQNVEVWSSQICYTQSVHGMTKQHEDVSPQLAWTPQACAKWLPSYTRPALPGDKSSTCQCHSNSLIELLHVERTGPKERFTVLQTIGIKPLQPLPMLIQGSYTELSCCTNLTLSLSSSTQPCLCHRVATWNHPYPIKRLQLLDSVLTGQKFTSIDCLEIYLCMLCLHLCDMIDWFLSKW